ncbi:hypothetical protein ES703_102391 [subsurface metagenome]
MQDIDKTIELLSDHCDRGATTLDDNFKEAVRMGKQGLQILAHSQGHRLDDLSLQLLLGAERKGNGTRESSKNS